MFYYKNIANFPITVDGNSVKPGDVCRTKHYVHNKYMLKVDEPVVITVITDEPVRVENINIELVAEPVETGVEKQPKAKRKAGRPSKATETVSETEPKDETKINETINSEEIDNG